MIDIADYVIMAFATFRFAIFFTQERGPGDIFLKIREAAGIQHDTLGEPDMWTENFIAEVLTCVWCFSMWFSFGVVIAYAVVPVWTIWICLPFSLSSVALLANNILRE